MPESASLTPTTVISLIETQQALLGISDEAICQAVGFDRPAMLTLIKAGTLRLPLVRVPALAVVLKLEPARLLTVALRESDPTLLSLLEEVMCPMQLSTTEINLIRHLRQVGGDQKLAPLVFDGKTVVALVSA